MPSSNRILAVGAAVAAGLMIAGGAVAAQASTSTPTASTGYGQQGSGGPGEGRPGDGGHGWGGHDGSRTPVTGDEATKVKAAVTAKDSAVTVADVFKDQDGSYDAMGTKAGQPVHVEISQDLKSVEIRTGGPGGDHGGRQHTPASATETTQVTAAIKAKDASVTVERVMKDEDGTFRAMGTKAGQRVMVEVSKDLKTVTVRTGMPGRGDHESPGQAPSGGPTGAPTGGAPAGYTA